MENELDKVKGDNFKLMRLKEALIEELSSANVKLSSLKGNEKHLEAALRQKEMAEESLNTIKQRSGTK